MFKREIKKQNKFFRTLLKLMNVYAIDKEKFDFVNPNIKNNSQNYHLFNKISFNLSAGYTEINRKIENFDIFLRFSPSVDLWNSKGSWKRIIPNIDKEILIKVCAHSLKKSLLNFFMKSNINMTLYLIFDQSNDKFNNDLINILKNKYFPVKLFETDIKGNRGSYLKCCDLAKNSKDLIFFCEDDYLFEKNFFDEVLFSFTKISSMLKQDIFICPSDYTFFYDKNYQTFLMIGKDSKWRKVNETLLTFIFSKKLYNKHYNNIRLVGEKINDPFEKPLHYIYEENYCFAPIGSLCHHISRSIPSDNNTWLETWKKNYNDLYGGP